MESKVTSGGRENFSYFEEGDYLELTSIDFTTGVGSITFDTLAPNWLKNYSSSPNFVLEIWSSFLFIEAQKLTINDIEYEVEVPLN
ncbi:hypothetical protein D3C72_1204610 [compost metagenome]